MIKDHYPKVSIIIPVYNGGGYLAKAIDSALNQTYPNFEVIVINDGSTDRGETSKIAGAFGTRIRYFQKKNGGVSSALNMGIKKMKGEYFAWLSHDDLFYPDKIEKQVKFLLENPEFDIVSGNFDLIDHTGAKIGEYLHNTNKIIRNGRDIFNSWINGCTLLIRKKCFDKVGLFDEKNMTTQDAQMWFRLVKYYPIYFLDDKLIMSRRHKGQGSVKNYAGLISGIDMLFKYLLENFDVSFFSTFHEKENGNTASAIYGWLGDQAVLRRSYKSAGTCYGYSRIRNNRLSSICQIKRFLCNNNLGTLLYLILISRKKLETIRI